MTTSWRRLTLRARLAIMVALVFGLMLMVYALAVYLLIRDRFIAELDHRLDQELEIAERSIGRNTEGKLYWQYAHQPEGTAHHDGGKYRRNVAWLDVWLADGQLALRHQDAASVSGDAPVLPLNVAQMGLHSLELPGEVHLRLLQRQIPLAGERLVLRAALREDDFSQGLTAVFWGMVGGLPFALLMVAVGGYWLAGSGLRPISRMADGAQDIHAGRLDARLPVDNPHDEPGRLALAFNDLLARLEAAFREMRRFTADASHELRTPLTVIRSVGEVGLRQPHSAEEYRDIIGTMLEEVDRLTLLTALLLELTRTESGQVTLEHKPFDLCDLLRDAASFMGVLAEEAQVNITLDLPTHPVQVDGNWVLLRQALVNLLDNALKHSPSGATVAVACRAGDGQAEITVSDQGKGIPPEQLPHIFRRFYRADTARTREAGGFGLGLAIARQAVEAHGGGIGAESVPGKGSVFRIVLPVEVASRSYPRRFHS